MLFERGRVVDGLRQYILSAAAGALICGIVTAFCQKGAYKKHVSMLCGLFMTFTLLRPLIGIKIPELPDLNEYFSQAESAVEEGKRISLSAQKTIISQECETYILDKAEELQVSLTADVTVEERGGKPIPVFVEMTGAVLPEIQQQLSTVIATDLGIPKENQLWIVEGS